MNDIRSKEIYETHPTEEIRSVIGYPTHISNEGKLYIPLAFVSFFFHETGTSTSTSVLSLGLR